MKLCWSDCLIRSGSPKTRCRQLPDDRLAFLTFPVDRPELFDAVISDNAGRVSEIQVKQPDAASRWVWGAFKLSGAILHDLHRLWCDREPRDEYIGTLVNAYLAAGGEATAVPSGSAYVDVGTLGGYREAMRLLADLNSKTVATPAPLEFKSRRLA